MKNIEIRCRLLENFSECALDMKHFQRAYFHPLPSLNVLVFVFSQHSILFEIAFPHQNFQDSLSCVANRLPRL